MDSGSSRTTAQPGREAARFVRELCALVADFLHGSPGKPSSIMRICSGESAPRRARARGPVARGKFMPRHGRNVRCRNRARSGRDRVPRRPRARLCTRALAPSWSAGRRAGLRGAPPARGGGIERADFGSSAEVEAHWRPDSEASRAFVATTERCPGSRTIINDASVRKVAEDVGEASHMPGRLVTETRPPVARGLLAHDRGEGQADLLPRQRIGKAGENAFGRDAQPAKPPGLKIVFEEFPSGRALRAEPIGSIEKGLVRNVDARMCPQHALEQRRARATRTNDEDGGFSGVQMRSARSETKRRFDRRLRNAITDMRKRENRRKDAGRPLLEDVFDVCRVRGTWSLGLQESSLIFYALPLGMVSSHPRVLTAPSPSPKRRMCLRALLRAGAHESSAPTALLACIGCS